MGTPIRDNSGRTSTPPDLAASASAQASATPTTTAPPTSPPVSQEQAADQAAADLEMLTLVHRRAQPRRRSPATEPRRSEFTPPTPRRVAERAVANANDTAHFFDAMEPTEQTQFMEKLAEKITGGIIDDMQGMVEVFNGIRARINEGRREQGEPELPPVRLDAGRFREMLEHGMEAALDKAVHAVLETALHAIFGAPSRLPLEQDPANSLGRLPDLNRDPSDQGLRIQWTQSF